MLSVGFLAFFLWQSHVTLQKQALRLIAGGCPKAAASWSASHLAITAAATFAAGIIGGMLGISGGMLMVPVLLGKVCKGLLWFLGFALPLAALF